MCAVFFGKEVNYCVKMAAFMLAGIPVPVHQEEALKHHIRDFENPDKLLICCGKDKLSHQFFQHDEGDFAGQGIFLHPPKT